jgi:hypothetical protein
MLASSLQGGSTLFRSNTPLSKLLEATMRLTCGEFLRQSLGRTVAQLIVSDNTGSVDAMVQNCWDEAYGKQNHSRSLTPASRACFPR